MAQASDMTAQGATSRLLRLWKGTLLVGVAAAYLLLAALLYLHHGWRAALLAVFLLALAQFLRYIGTDVDRIGWNLEQGERDADPNAARYQRRLLGLLAALAQLVNLALVAQAMWLGGADRALATLGALALVEALLWQVRKANRRVAFEQASYGFREGAPFPGPDAAKPWDDAKRAALARKLERLRQLAEEGEISQRAYRRARDKHKVRSVMEQPD